MIAAILAAKASAVIYPYLSLYETPYFGVGRAYMTLKGGEEWGGRLTVDAAGKVDTTGKILSYLKYAYLFGKGAWGYLEAGLVHDLWIDWEQKVWGFRFVDKVPADGLKVAHSADFGVLYTYKADNFKVSGAIYNGSGYKHLFADTLNMAAAGFWFMDMVGAVVWVPVDSPDSLSANALLYKKAETWAGGIGGGTKKGEAYGYAYGRVDFEGWEPFAKAVYFGDTLTAVAGVSRKLSKAVKVALAGYYKGEDLSVQIRAQAKF